MAISESVLAPSDDPTGRIVPRLTGLPIDAVASLALSRGWPQSLALRGFPIGSGRNREERTLAFLRECVKRRLVDVHHGEPPWSEPWYVVSRHRRHAVVEELTSLHRFDEQHFVEITLSAAQAMRDALAEEEPPPQIARWLDLAVGWSVTDMADALDLQIEGAIEDARKAKLTACPEALRWIETAEPMVEVFGGQLEIAYARSLRRLELFDRQSRDELLLANYVPRAEHEAAFDRLLAKDNPAWALHFIGYGGAGKTMLMRRIRTRLARERGLTTARIDFDRLNPNYPVRAPGLLLMGFAEELRLHDDPVAASLFRRFDTAMRAVHEKVDSSFRARSGSVHGGWDVLEMNFRDAETCFIDALRQISRTSTPVMILDTCEELAKARPPAGIPAPLAATFGILENLQAQVPALRVVLAGRRLLADRGFGWSVPDQGRGERPYLDLVEMRGFDDGEAKAMVELYRRDGLSVPEQLRPVVLLHSRSGEARIVKSLQREQPDFDVPEVPRYNPYDLDLFASLCCRKQAPTEQELHEGRATFVRERLTNRLAPEVRAIVAELAVIGWFDRDIIETLTGRSGEACDAIWKELKDQEWIDVDRTARTGFEVWGMEPHVQRRIFEFTTPGEALGARQRLRPILHDITLSRPWSGLVISFFTVMLELLSDDPAAGAQWWDKVEQRICEGGQWEWAQEITAVLVDEEGIAGRPDHPLRAAILATRAAAMFRRDPQELANLWPQVLVCAAHHPLAAGRYVLQFRAQAGLVTVLHTRPDRIAAHNIGDLVDAARRVMAIPSPPAPLDTHVQIVGSEASWLESTADLLEQMDGTGLPDDAFLQELKARATRLRETMLGDVAAILEARFDALAGVAGRLDFGPPARRGETVEFLDWLAPLDVAARTRLEWARLNRPFLPHTFESVPSISSLDEDRHAALLLLAATHHGPPTIDLRKAVADSLALAREPPQCLAHARISPFFAVALESMGESGLFPSARLAVALESMGESGLFPSARLDLQTIAGDSRLPLEARQSAQRSLLRLAMRDRAALGQGSAAGVLEQSSRLADMVLVAGQAAFDPSRGAEPYRGRWQEAVEALIGRRQDPRITASFSPDASFAAVSLHLDAAEATDASDQADDGSLGAWERQHPRHWLERAILRVRLGLEPQVGRRLAAQLLFDEGSLLSLRHPERGADRLEMASQLYGDVADGNAQAISAIAAALARARQGDEVGLTRVLDSPCLAGPDGTPSQLDEAWSLRLRFARCRAAEFDRPGPLTEALDASAGSGGISLPLDLKGVLKAVAPVAASPAWRAQWTNGALVVVGGVLLIGFAVLVIHAIQWLAGRFGSTPDDWTVLGWMLGVGVAASAFPFVMRFALRLLFRVMRPAIAIRSEGAVVDQNQPLRESTTAVTIHNGLPLLRTLTPSTASRLRTSQADRYLELAELVPPMSPSLNVLMTLLGGLVVMPPIELQVDPRCAAANWEAILGTNGGRAKGLSQMAFRYRRIGLASYRATPGPLAAPVAVQLWSSGPSLSARMPWSRAAARRRRFDFATRWTPDGWVQGAPILHLVCEVIEGSGGLELHLDNAMSNHASRDHDVRRGLALEALTAVPASAPRLCILQGFDLPALARSSGDRMAAGLMRRAAAKLFDAGIPAVLVIPGLPETLSARAIQLVAKAVTDAPPRGTTALMSTVRKIQRVVAPGTDDPDALERALDVCLYCIEDLNLAVQA